MAKLGFMINRDILTSYEVHLMPKEDFVAQFYAAVEGEINELSKFVKPWNGRMPAHEWNIVRKRIFARDDYTCKYCGARNVKLECDHVQPLSRGGSDDDDNLVTACKACNRAKRDKTLDEWKGQNGSHQDN